jgi:ribonuclease BN (tRNA processing enzyme)
MKITILGSGTCGSQLPGVPNRFPPAFLVEWDGEKLLFDCSEGVRFRLEHAGYYYADLHHIAISHCHPDHNALVHYVQSVCCWNGWAGPPNPEINIYTTNHIVEEFPTIWKFFTPDDPERNRHNWPKLKFHAMPDAHSTIKIGSGELTAKKVYHGFGKTDAISFRLETPDGVFAYSGDTGECSGIREICQDADVFICEASARIGDLNNPVNYGHLHPKLVGEIAKEAKVKKVIFFHYTGLDSDEAMIADCRSSGYAGELICGKDFEVHELSADQRFSVANK